MLSPTSTHTPVRGTQRFQAASGVRGSIVHASALARCSNAVPVMSNGENNLCPSHEPAVLRVLVEAAGAVLKTQRWTPAPVQVLLQNRETAVAV